MRAFFSFAALVTCALSVHCSDAPSWDREGRIYARANLTAKRVDASFATEFYPVAAGDAVYQVSLEFAPGTLPRREEDVYPFVYLREGQTLAAGDEPVACQVSRDDGGTAYRTCASLLTGEGPNDIDLRAGEEDLASWVSFDMNRLTERVVFEVRRPATAPSLEGAIWEVFLADQACELALDNHHRFPACPEGAECTLGGIEYQIEGSTCRWRNE